MKSNKKLPHELSDDELLSGLETDKATQSDGVSDNESVLGFLSFYNIKPGDQRVRTRTMYELYMMWSNAPVGFHVFVKSVGRIIGQKAVKNSYEISEESIELHKEIWKKVQDRTNRRLKSPTYKSHFEAFLAGIGAIKTEKSWIHQDELYKLYDKWAYKNKSKKSIHKSMFPKFCDMYFKSRRLTDKAERWYGVRVEKEEEESPK